MKVKAYIVVLVLVLVLITLTTSCISRENFFDLANDIINSEIKISGPGLKGLNFGDVEQYSSKDETITLENSGDIDLIITEIKITGSAPAEFSVNYSQMPLVVEVGGITTFRVIFKPSVLGSKDALITIVNNDSSDDKYSIPVFGVGKKPTGPVISVSLKNNDVSDMDAVDFGSIENGRTSLPARFVIENIGYSDLIIRDIFPAAEDIHSFIVDDMLTSYTIGAGESSTFDVVFHPVGDDELKSVIVIESNALNTDNYSIGVSGYGFSSTEPEINVIQQGTDPNLLGISGYESFNFGTVSSVRQDTMIFSVQNTGTYQLTVSSILSSNPAFFQIQSLIPPAYINEGESVTFEVIFSPGIGLEDEELVAVISIDSDDPDIFENPYTFEVRGTRTNDFIAKLKVHQDGFYITPDTGIYSFGQEDIDTQTTVSFTLENVGRAELVVDQIISNNVVNFEITNIPRTVDVGFSETFEITFKLTEVGVFSGVITIDSNDPDLSSGFVFNVTGESTSLPKIKVYADGNVDEFEHNTPYKFGSVEVGSTKGPVWFEIKNTGEADLVIDLPILIDVEDSRHFELDTTSIADFVIKKDGSESFYVTFKPDEEGTFHNSSGVAVEFATNDPDRKLFRIRLWGEGTSD